MTTRYAKEALVVVHPSSIDSFFWHAREARGAPWARDECENLADEIVRAAGAHPVVAVIDQGWDGDCAEALRSRLRELPSTIWIAHDEDADGWDALRASLPAILRDAGAASAKLAGFWFDGCVRAVAEILQQAGMPARIDSDLCGHELDEDDYSADPG
jgi:hypothetical protein